jgi:hypothetical protein
VTRPGGRRAPARRVIYRSVKARVARVAIGLLFVGVTLWIVLPVLASEHAPPAPTALYVGVNGAGPAPLHQPPGSVLKLAIHASGCSNPVTVEGRLDRSERDWTYDEHVVGIDTNGPLPSQASVVLVGARLRTANIAIGAPMPSTEAGDIFGETPIHGTATVEDFGLGRRVTVHNSLSRVAVERRSSQRVSVALLTSPEWSEVKTPLLFVLKADLVFPLGFHRCYLDLPELFSYEEELSSGYRSAYGQAMEFADPLAVGQSPLGKLTGLSKGLSVTDVDAAEVSVSLAARVAAVSSVGDGGSITPTGLRYECHTFFEDKPPPNLEPNMFTNEGTGPSTYEEHTNPNCAGEPIFEVPGVAADITRRIFLAGILGALAATLIVEALFLGETALKRPRRA